MNWIIEMIYPLIKDCETPQDARKKVIEWGRFQEPRDAALGLIALDVINGEYKKVVDNAKNQTNG